MRSRNKIHGIKGLIGRNIMIRTVTMILTGYVDDITEKISCSPNAHGYQRPAGGVSLLKMALLIRASRIQRIL